MARIRAIKPDFWKSETLAEVSFAARLLFAGLWTQADREGRLECRPRRIKLELFPWDDVDVSALLSELAVLELVVLYEREGRPLIQVTNFLEHQKPHPKETSYDLPAPDLADRQVSRDRAVKFHGKPGSFTASTVDLDLDLDCGSGSGSQPPASTPPRMSIRELVEKPTTPPAEDIEFFAWCMDAKTRALPGAFPENPPPGFAEWFPRALAGVGGDKKRLCATWIAWLRDDWAASRRPPFSFVAFIGRDKWREFVPPKTEAA